MQRTVNVFVYLLSHFQFSFAKSNVFVLSSFDLKVSQVSFSVIGRVWLLLIVDYPVTIVFGLNL